ncbi:MAG: hypothetical protein ACOYMW_12755 [Candidatus Competibacteraceae bacterium]
MSGSIDFSKTSNPLLLTDPYQPDDLGGIQGKSDMKAGLDKPPSPPPQPDQPKDPSKPLLVPPNNFMGLEEITLAITALKSKIMDTKIQASGEEIKANAGQQTAKNKERIAKLEESMKKLEEANKAQEAARIVGWVATGLSGLGLLFGAITSIGSIGLGIFALATTGWTGIGAVGGALLIAGGVIGLAGTAVGAVSFGVGVTLAVLNEIPEVKDWMSNTDVGKAVYWTLFAYQMVTGLVGAVAGFVGAIVSAAGGVAVGIGKAVEAATKIAVEVVKTVIKAAVDIAMMIAEAVLAAVQGGVQIAKGALTITQSVHSFDASMSRAAARHIEANLVEFQAAMEEENKRLKRLIGELSDGFSACMAILNQATQTKETVISKMKTAV